MDGNATIEGLHRLPENSPIQVGVAAKASIDHPEGSQDAAFVMTDKKFSQSPKFFGIFDGVGGRRGGNIASTIAGREIRSAIENGDIDPNLSLEQTVGLVKNVILKAHEKVQENATGEWEGMATTASMCALWEGKNGERKLVVGNVGDSRVYVRRVNELIQLTKDDNLAAEGRPNVITQAVGDRTIEPRMGVFDILPGDQIITVSDGVSDALAEDLPLVFNEALSKGLSPDEAAKEITEKAREFSNSGRKMDDQTTIVVTINESGADRKDSHYIEASRLENKAQPTERKWIPGTMVKVRRSSGEVEDDWFVNEIGNDGKILVRKGELKKYATPRQLESINPDIQNVTDWNELFYSINQLGDAIQGSRSKFTRDQMINLAQKIKSGQINLSEMTRTNGLRDKVEELMRLDLARKQLKAA